MQSPRFSITGRSTRMAQRSAYLSSYPNKPVLRDYEWDCTNLIAYYGPVQNLLAGRSLYDERGGRPACTPLQACPRRKMQKPKEREGTFSCPCYIYLKIIALFAAFFTVLHSLSPIDVEQCMIVMGDSHGRIPPVEVWLVDMVMVGAGPTPTKLCV
jgi:hypothetical protein